MTAIEEQAKTTFAWLEITGKCQLECGHCYADSGPQGTHGAMQLADWLQAVDQLAAAGVGSICVIGGEPTLHPDLGAIVDRALGCGMGVEVYSNLVHVTDEQWRLFERRRVSLAMSYYSSDPDEHARIVGRPTFERTTDNIAVAQKRGIPVRVGMVRVLPAQRIAAAKEVLGRYGITQIRVDDLRGVGRGIDTGAPDCSALCGRCASGKVAITPDGDVYPCVFSRWLPVGNVLETSLTEILGGEQLAATRADLTGAFATRAEARVTAGEPHTGARAAECVPHCSPDDICEPSPCGPLCGPLTRPDVVATIPAGADKCVPDGGCRPSTGCDPYSPVDRPDAVACNPDLCPPTPCGPECGPLRPAQPAAARLEQVTI